VDRSGVEISGTERRWKSGGQPDFSPDGKGLLLSLGTEADRSDIWRYDLTSRNWTPLTRTPSDDEVFPAWAPDGERFAFTSGRTSPVQGNEIGIYVQSAEPGEADVLIDSPGTEALNDWDPATGRILYYRVETDERRRDLWYLEPDGRGGYEAKVFLSTLFDERTAAFSPDGRWVAYVTDQEGSSEIYVRKFPEGSPVSKVSRQGGEAPRWRRDGRELYYVEAQTLMVVEVTAGDVLSFGRPAPLFSDPGLLDDPLFRRYDAAPDGRSFAVMSFSEEVLASPPVIRVVENWFEECRGREKN
jgi:Tol biopolymer transport system component